MKAITKKQENDLFSILYFLPQKKVKITKEDTRDFFNFSDRGEMPKRETKGYEALKEGKRWRGIHMRMYEEGIMDGSVPYSVLLEEMPQKIVSFISKEMFKGKDKKLIYEQKRNIK